MSSLTFLQEFYNIVHVREEQTLKPDKYIAKTYVMYEKGDPSSELYYTEIFSKENDTNPVYLISVHNCRFMPWESNISVYENDELIIEHKNPSRTTNIAVPNDKDPIYYVNFY